MRAWDAKTGELRWTFETIPRDGQFGVETWEGGSHLYTGNTNVWSMMSADEELGLVYLPIGTPTNDFYGGHRLGDNLFAESLVAVDLRTGKRRWHFQTVHHGLWDYDPPSRTQPGGSRGGRPRDQGGRADQQTGVHLRTRPRDG